MSREKALVIELNQVNDIIFLVLVNVVIGSLVTVFLQFVVITDKLLYHSFIRNSYRYLSLLIIIIIHYNLLFIVMITNYNLLLIQLKSASKESYIALEIEKKELVNATLLLESERRLSLEALALHRFEVEQLQQSHRSEMITVGELQR